MNYFAFIIGLSWIIFWIYWLAAAISSRPMLRPRNPQSFFTIRLVIIIMVLIAVPLFNRLPQTFRDQALAVTLPTQVLGLMIFAVGAIVAVWARLALGKEWGMPMTEKAKPKLITYGPYSFIRHPIYTGILMMGFGSVLDVNAYWLIPLVIGSIYFTYSAVKEEQLMAKQFPGQYSAYKNRTKMLVPWVF